MFQLITLMVDPAFRESKVSSARLSIFTFSVLSGRYSIAVSMMNSISSRTASVMKKAPTKRAILLSMFFLLLLSPQL